MTWRRFWGDLGTFLLDFGTFWSFSRVIQGHSGGAMGVSWGFSWVSCGDLGVIWDVLGCSGGVLG